MSDFETVSEALFAKEFRLGLKQISGRGSYFTINDLPTPFNNPELGHYCVVRGVTDSQFKVLNTRYVSVVGNVMKERRQYDENGDVKLIKRDWRCPKGCLIVRSVVQVRLSQQSVYDKREFGLIDYRDDELGSTRVYYYYLHKKYLFKVNMCALVVSENKRSVEGHLGGERLLLRNGSNIYLYILPMKSRKLTKGYRILCLRPDMDFGDELFELKLLWRELGLIYEDINNFQLTTEDGSAINLVSEFYQGELEYLSIEPKSVFDHEVAMQNKMNSEREFV